PARRYVEALVGSVQLFLVAILFWVLALTGLFYLTNEWSAKDPSWVRALGWAVTCFFGIQPPTEVSTLIESGAVWVSIVGMLLRFLHWGIFISHLYSLITRR